MLLSITFISSSSSETSTITKAGKSEVRAPISTIYMEYQQEWSDQQKGEGVEKDFWFHPWRHFLEWLGFNTGFQSPNNEDLNNLKEKYN